MKNKKVEKIRINVYEDSLYADYGIENEELLDEMLVDAVEKTANAKPIKRNLELNFIAAKDVEIERNRFVEAYKNTVQNKIDTKQREIARCLVTGAIMVAVSIALLFAYVYFFSKQTLFWSELADVVTWVFSWASVEILTVELIQLFIDKSKYKRLLRAKIVITNKTK